MASASFNVEKVCISNTFGCLAPVNDADVRWPCFRHRALYKECAAWAFESYSSLTRPLTANRPRVRLV